MHGRDVLAPGHVRREFVFAARDRADETVDRIRSARSQRFKYIRNHYPSRPWLQPNRYKDEKAILRSLRRLHATGDLGAGPSLILAEERPREELYDLASDPHELHNLAGDPAWSVELARHREALRAWTLRHGDAGADAEPDDAYVANALRDNAGPVLRSNVQLMQRWKLERPMEP